MALGLTTSAAEWLALAALLYTLYGALYRLVLSPVAKFPGPRLAALTFWYEFYYDVVKGGTYVYEIERMHAKYGPIVRINPYELHVKDNDLDWMNRLYPNVGKEVDKFWWSAGMFGSNKMAFGTIGHGLHKMRRDAFGKFFSPAAIRNLEPVLQSIVSSLCARIEESVRVGKTVNMVHAYSALTQDIITEYCFASPRGVVDMPDFAPIYYEWMKSQCRMTPVIKQFPWLLPTLDLLPDFWVKATNPMAWDLRLQTRDYHEQTQRIIQGGDADKTAHATIFHKLYNNPELPIDEKTPARLVAEAGAVVGAGTTTTAHMLSLTTFFVFSTPAIYDQLIKELTVAMPDRNAEPDLQTLEKLPYLTAVIDEGLRLSYGVMHRLSRVQPRNALQYGDWVIPPNVPVGMTPYMLHRDPAIFPEPEKFDPNRWFKLELKDRERLEKYIFSFGKGSRRCAALRLAYVEMYLTLACVVRRLGDRVKLFDTEYARDVQYVRDYFVPAPSFESRGIRVVAA